MSTPAPVEPAREFDLVPPDNARLANLCGPLDENLRLIEERMGVSVKRRGSSFRIVGQRAHAAEDLVRSLFETSNREEISLDRVHLALRDTHDMPGALVADIGAGTGLLAELFLKNGYRVLGVEPNREMRQAGARDWWHEGPRYVIGLAPA